MNETSNASTETPKRIISIIEYAPNEPRKYGQSAELFSQLAEQFIYGHLHDEAPYSKDEKFKLESLKFEVELEVDRLSDGISALGIALELCFDDREVSTLGNKPMADIAKLIEIASGLIKPLSTLAGQLTIAIGSTGKGGSQ